MAQSPISTVQDVDVIKKPKKKIRVPKGFNPVDHSKLLATIDIMIAKQSHRSKLKKVIRRKSCCCSWCGFESEKAKKHHDIVIVEEEPQQTDKSPLEKMSTDRSSKRKRGSSRNSMSPLRSKNSVGKCFSLVKFF